MVVLPIFPLPGLTFYAVAGVGEIVRWERLATVPGVVADRIASAVIPDPLLRQELLETLDVGRRLDRLAAALDDLLRQAAT